MTECNMHWKVWIDLFRAVCVGQAEHEEAAAQAASLVKAVVSLREGPAAGLKRQHAFTRAITGWVPIAVTSAGETELNGYGIMDGISESPGERWRVRMDCPSQ